MHTSRSAMPPARHATTRLLAAATLVGLGGLTACSAAPDTAAQNSPTSTTATSSSSPGSAPLVVSQGWAIAQPDTKAKTMTGIFGEIRNSTAAPVTIVSVTTSASKRAELHQTTSQNGSMQMKATPSLTVPAGGVLKLAPGHDHVMAMDMTRPLAVGDRVDVTLRTSDGRSVSFVAVAKPFTRAPEPYAS